MTKRKHPVALLSPGGGKVPRSVEQQSTEDHQISWHLRTLDVHGPFGWHAMDKATLLDRVHDALRNFETMKWSEIKSAKKQHHTIPVASLSKVARDRIEKLRLGIDEVFSLRVTSKERIIGIRDRQFFQILWWDEDHQVCPARLKHT